MEFQVGDGGRLRLRRRTMFGSFGDTGLQPYGWTLVFVVEGMAGAVTVRFNALEHGSAGRPSERPGGHPTGADEFAIRCVWVPAGVEAHAFRPWPTGEDGKVAAPVPAMGGVPMFSQRLDPLSLNISGEWLRQLANPGGASELWEQLEAAYMSELCPPYPDEERLAQLEATVAALERAQEGVDPPAAAVESEPLHDRPVELDDDVKRKLEEGEEAPPGAIKRALRDAGDPRGDGP